MAAAFPARRKIAAMVVAGIGVVATAGARENSLPASPQTAAVADTATIAVPGDWPCWRGPNGNGSAPDPGFKLVDDLGKAKLLWKSDQEIPSDCKGRWAGGFSSPVVADGRVFLFYYRPHGRESFEYTKEDDPTGSKNLARNPTSEWHADDVIHCFDAMTGKTLWKFVDERGLIGAHWKEGGHYVPCTADGRVYSVGTTGRFYCVDAATGKLVWETYLKGANKDAFERSKAAGKSVLNRAGLNQAPCAVNGVVAVAADGGIAGFEGATGQKLWTVGAAGGGGRGVCPIPVIWTHKGTRYFVAGNTCIEPRTGKVLWQIPGAVTTTAPCVTENYYICSGLAGPAGKKEPAAGSTCFRITPQGAEKVWSMAPGRSPAMHCTDVVCGPYFVQAADDGENSRNIFVIEIATGKQVATIDNTFRKLGYSPLSCQGMIFGGMYTLTHFKIDPKESREVKVPFSPAGVGQWGDWNNSCSPALAVGRLYYRTVRNLVCYDLRDTAGATT
jgi:outer membrane protein assembly factor BamB